MTRRLRSGLVAGALAALAFVLSSCTAPHPSVTFYGDRAAVSVGPQLWCDVDTANLKVNCPPDAPGAGDSAVLVMGTDKSLQINVPGEVADAPWFVTFAYRDAAGKVQTERSEVIADGRLSYTVPSRGKGTQLIRAEVDSGLVPTQDSKGNAVFFASRVWVLAVTPKPAPAAD